MSSLITLPLLCPKLGLLDFVPVSVCFVLLCVPDLDLPFRSALCAQVYWVRNLWNLDCVCGIMNCEHWKGNPLSCVISAAFNVSLFVLSPCALITLSSCNTGSFHFPLFPRFPELPVAFIGIISPCPTLPYLYLRLSFLLPVSSLSPLTNLVSLPFPETILCLLCIQALSAWWFPVNISFISLIISSSGFQFLRSARILPATYYCFQINTLSLWSFESIHPNITELSCC